MGGAEGVDLSCTEASVFKGVSFPVVAGVLKMWCLFQITRSDGLNMVVI